MNKRELLERFKVGGTITSLGRQPAGSPNNDWGQDRFAYRVHLRRRDEDGEKRAMTVLFYTGIGWDHPPDLADVVDNLASDAAIVDNDEFEDVQATPKQRRALIDQHARFMKLMGNQYHEIVYETERN